MLEEIRAIAFDVDNTLVDILGTKQRVFHIAGTALTREGVPGTPKEHADGLFEVAVESWIDRPDIVTTYLDQEGLEVGSTVANSVQSIIDGSEASVAGTYEGVIEVLFELQRRGYRLAGVTDAPRDRAEKRLHATGLARWFETVVFLEDTKEGKADAAPYLLAAERLCEHPAHVLTVGDHPVRDVSNPKSEGMKGALTLHGVRSEFNETEAPVDPDLVLEKLPELLSHLSGAPSASRGPVPRGPSVRSANSWA